MRDGIEVEMLLMCCGKAVYKKNNSAPFCRVEVIAQGLGLWCGHGNAQRCWKAPAELLCVSAFQQCTLEAGCCDWSSHIADFWVPSEELVNGLSA